MNQWRKWIIKVEIIPILNIKKYLRFISSGYIPSFWVAPDNLQPEIQKPIKVKLSKPSYKSKNKINKMEYKYKSKKTAKS